MSTLSAPRRPNVRHQLDRWFPRVFGIAFTFALWYTIATVFPNQLMPYPLETLSVTVDLYTSGVAIKHLRVSLIRIFIGFLGAMALGTTTGIIMGSTDFGEKFLAPFVVMGLAIPTVALAAIMTLIWGFTFAAPVAAATFSVFPFVAINIWKGVENIDSELLEMSSAFGVSNYRLLRRVIIPNTAPSLFAAIRFGLALSWKVVTVTEIFASSSGIGYKVLQSYDLFRFTETWAWAIVFLVVIILVEYLIFKPIERRAFAYRPDAEFELVGAD